MPARSTDAPSRWLAAASVVVMLASGVVLVSVLRERAAAPPGGGGAFAQSRREGVRVGGEFVQSRREGARVGGALAQSRREGEAARWRAVLAGLDRRRAAAYAAADPALLARVYTHGSPALRRDRRLLTRYRDRGLRVRGLRMDVLDLRVRRARRDRVVLVVHERLADGTVTGPRSRSRLPDDDADRRVLVLRRADDRGWRVAAVRAAA